MQQKGHSQIQRRIVILGSTGSIGRQTLDVVRSFPDVFQVVALVARNNVRLLAEQAAEFKPQLVACTSTDRSTRRWLHDLLPTAFCDPDAALAAATHADADVVVAAMSGVVGVGPVLAAIAAGRNIALANKETLVMAGHLVMSAARQRGVSVLPVDSEHSAIWQCMRGEQPSEVRRLLLTASGGPFRRMSREAMEKVTVEQALAHPTWHMGPKVTIDSSTLMNKGLEAIEAHWLFDISYDKIDVVIHPQSIVHSMVEFVDNSIKLQASLPSMHLPIQDALSYPYRLNRSGTPLISELRWSQVAHLDFDEVDTSRFPCLPLAFEAGKKGGTAPAVLAGADEQAVALFLQGHLHLTEIAPIIEHVLAHHSVVPEPDLETVLASSEWAQAEVLRLYGSSWKPGRELRRMQAIGVSGREI
jgi:1-deoxy-D-xylulose-5-phosphate reductoisomerase